MTLTRPGLIGSGATIVTLSRRPAWAQGGGRTPTIRVGALINMSGVYRDVQGPTAVACVRQAVQEITASKSVNVEVVAADFQNKPDIAAAIVREWFDRDGVDMVVGMGNSAVALAVSGIGREKNKVIMVSEAATSEVTGRQCSPNTVHWTYDSWMLAKSTATSITKNGGKTWFLMAPNYVLGRSLAQDTARFVKEAGGTVLKTASYPFPETTDFSAYLQQALASGAKVLGLCNSGADTVNGFKQAREFGLSRTMQLAGMLIQITEVHAVGAEAAQGLQLTESFYWNLNERTRAFTDRIRPKIHDSRPNMVQAGDYAATLHYLKAVADMGAAAAKSDGGAVVARMKAMPIDDDCFGKGYVRADGRKIHPCYLFEVKAPAESKGEWDLYKLVATTPAEEAFRPLSEGGCPLVHN